MSIGKIFGNKSQETSPYTGADLQPDDKAGAIAEHISQPDKQAGVITEQISQPELTHNGMKKPIELVKQLISNKFIEVSLQMVATPTGLQNGMVFMIANQSGRGMEKKSIPIAFEPVTGWLLSDFTKEELGL